VGFCSQLDPVHHQACELLGQAAVSLMGWAWLRRAILGPKAGKLAAQFPPDWQIHATALFTAWDHAVRVSSAVENWHSILRPFIAVHRCLSADLLAILAVWHNHRRVPRGQNLGQSPLTRAGLAKEPTDWLVALGYPHLASPAPQQSQSLRGSSQPERENIAA